MELTINYFRKIILLCILIFVVNVSTIGADFLPFFTNYELLDEQLFQGYVPLSKVPEVFLAIMLLPLVSYLAGLVLLYRLNPIGRPLFLVSIIIIVLFVMLGSDSIERSIFYPLDVIENFLDIFIIYLIYFTPLKKEFEKSSV
jgi:hypothetical protein